MASKTTLAAGRSSRSDQLPPGLAGGRVAHGGREPQAPVVTDSDPSARSNRQAADRLVRHLMLGLGVAGDVAEDDLAGLEPQGEGVAVGRAGQRGGPAFPGVHGCAGGPLGVVDPDRAIGEYSGDGSLARCPAAGDVHADEPLAGPGRGVQR